MGKKKTMAISFFLIGVWLSTPVVIGTIYGITKGVHFLYFLPLLVSVIYLNYVTIYIGLIKTRGDLKKK